MLLLIELLFIETFSYRYINNKYRDILIYQIYNVYYIKIGFCHVEIQKLCYINLVLRRELKVFVFV